MPQHCTRYGGGSIQFGISLRWKVRNFVTHHTRAHLIRLNAPRQSLSPSIQSNQIKVPALSGTLRTAPWTSMPERAWLQRIVYKDHANSDSLPSVHKPHAEFPNPVTQHTWKWNLKYSSSHLALALPRSAGVAASWRLNVCFWHYDIVRNTGDVKAVRIHYAVHAWESVLECDPFSQLQKWPSEQWLDLNKQWIIDLCLKPCSQCRPPLEYHEERNTQAHTRKR